MTPNSDVDLDLRHRIDTRRSFLLGLWAGRTLGHDGENLALYAGEVMAADLLVPGPADVVAKVHRDFVDADVETSRGTILMELRRCEDRAASELGSATPTWRTS